MGVLLMMMMRMRMIGVGGRVFVWMFVWLWWCVFVSVWDLKKKQDQREKLSDVYTHLGKGQRRCVVQLQTLSVHFSALVFKVCSLIGYLLPKVQIKQKPRLHLCSMGNRQQGAKNASGSGDVSFCFRHRLFIVQH